MNWTREQRQVIDLRDCNILVSAAAGSGKTAVLIQRILSRIMDTREPVDVDEFLIVTFTKAAAAQMKERLTQALEQALAEDPDNEHLQRQVMLVPMAQISTIHSFCTALAWIPLTAWEQKVSWECFRMTCWRRCWKRNMSRLRKSFFKWRG